MAQASSVAKHIKNYVSIKDLLNYYSESKKIGRRMFWRCPIHSEDSPSLTIDASRGSYKCFGCQKHGDIFQLVMDVEGCGFVEACRRIVEVFNVPEPIKQIRNQLHREVAELEKEGKKEQAREVFTRYIESRHES